MIVGSMEPLSNEAALRLIRMYMQNDYATSDSKTRHIMDSYAKELIKHGIFQKQRPKRKKITKVDSRRISKIKLVAKPKRDLGIGDLAHPFTNTFSEIIDSDW
jgi:hypothetical protein